MSKVSVESSYQESAAATKGDMAKMGDEIMLSNTPAKPTEGSSKVREVARKMGNTFRRCRRRRRPVRRIATHTHCVVALTCSTLGPIRSGSKCESSNARADPQ